MTKTLFRIAVILALGQFVSSANAKVMIYVDIDAQRMKVTNNDGQSYVWTISSGRDGFETPTGSFSVQRLDASHFSDEYDQAPMPYSIFFHEGFAIHGTNMGGLVARCRTAASDCRSPTRACCIPGSKRYGARSISAERLSSDAYFVSDTPAKGRSTGRSNWFVDQRSFRSSSASGHHEQNDEHIFSRVRARAAPMVLCFHAGPL